MLCAPFIPALADGDAIDPSALPDVWRASELAVSRATTCSTGHDVLDAELPSGRWPRSSLVKILPLQAGIGGLQLLKPALARPSKDQRIALVQPPHIPHAMAFQTWGLNTGRMLWMRAQSSGDALWTTEQILKNSSCGAFILWNSNVRAESLRRINLAAQGTDTGFCLMRPMACSERASPAPLRLSLRLAHGGVCQGQTFEQQRYRASELKLVECGHDEYASPKAGKAGLARSRQAAREQHAAIPIAAGLEAHQLDRWLCLAAAPEL